MTAEKIAELLNQTLHPHLLEVTDEEAAHAGHAAEGAGHFCLTIASPLFQGKSKIEAHRMIYTVLKPYMNNGIHALTIQIKA